MILSELWRLYGADKRIQGYAVIGSSEGETMLPREFSPNSPYGAYVSPPRFHSI